MTSSTYKLFKQSGGVGNYAEVTVQVDSSSEVNQVALSGTEFVWLKDSYGPDAWEWSVCDEYREGAIFGASYALKNHNETKGIRHVSVFIAKIHAHPAWSNRLNVAYAACFATWQALGDEGTSHPYFEGRTIIFPETPT